MGQLLKLLPAFAPPAIPAYLVYREGRKATARVRSFVDYAVGRLREHPALEGNESLSPRPQRSYGQTLQNNDVEPRLECVAGADHSFLDRSRATATQ